MQLMRDNLTLWTEEEADEGEGELVLSNQNEAEPPKPPSDQPVPVEGLDGQGVSGRRSGKKKGRKASEPKILESVEKEVGPKLKVRLAKQIEPPESHEVLPFSVNHNIHVDFSSDK